jgi:hypothetical protein
MAERNVSYTAGVAIPLAVGVAQLLYGGADSDTSIASLPSAPSVGAHTVRIRGTLVVTTATTGVVTIGCVRGQTTAGSAVSQAVITSALVGVGGVVPFEFVDLSPSLAANGNSLNYAITLLSAAGAGVGNLTTEIEEVN